MLRFHSIWVITANSNIPIPPNSRSKPKMVARIPRSLIIHFGWDVPFGSINLSSIIVKMLYFNPRKPLPLFKLLFRGLFDKKSDKTNFPKGLDGVRRKIISPPRPDDSVNSAFHKRAGKLVKE